VLLLIYFDFDTPQTWNSF